MVNKYKNKKVIIDNIKFDSKREAKRYTELKEMQEKGLISDLILQPVFMLQDAYKYGGKKYRPITYIADFQYVKNGKIVVEDVKGLKTDVFKIKLKLLLFKFLKENKEIDFRII